MKVTNHWQQRDITERPIELRLDRACRKLVHTGLIGTHNAELLTVLPDDIYWEAD